MAGKTKKKAARKKPSKKAPKKAAKVKAKAKAKSAKPAKKAAPKKAAPKKAAPKQAAPVKKAAAKKPAVKKPAVKKQPKEAIEPAEALDMLEATESDGASMDAGDDDDGGIEVVEASEGFADTGPKPSLQAEILAMARQLYGNKPDEELLALDPNDIDAMDPSMFYELLGEKYGVEADPENDYFGGFGGPIEKLIAFVESRWDGKTRKDTPMPPGDWLEEYVHPES